MENIEPMDSEFEQRLKNVDITNADELYDLADECSYHFEDDSKAFELLSQAANLGHIDAMCELAGLYEYGNGIKHRKKLAFQWYLKAAEKGSSTAIYKVAIRYELGNQVAKDINKAIYWYQKGAENKNDSQCKYALGRLYEQGIGVKQNYKKAFQFYKKAEKANEYFLEIEDLYTKLLECYTYGIGTSPNFAKAMDIYQKLINISYHYCNTEILTSIANSGNQEAQYLLAELLVNSDIEKAVDWYTKAAENNHSLAQYKLASLYNDGQDIEQDYSKAFFLFKKSADNGNVYAMFATAMCYKNGKGTQQNYANALKYFTAASQKGHIGAITQIAFLYQYGNGVKQDDNKMFKLHKKASKYISCSLCNLATCYKEGRGVKKNKKKAIQLLLDADFDDDGMSCINNDLGIAFENGDGVEQDYDKAFDYFNKAIEGGNVYALYNIANMFLQGKGRKKNVKKAKQYALEALNDKDEGESLKEQAIKSAQEGDKEDIALLKLCGIL